MTDTRELPSATQQAEELLAHDSAWMPKYLIVDGERVIRALVDELKESKTKYSNLWLKAITIKKQRDELREALLIIAGEKQCLDSCISNIDIAKQALTNTETSE